MRKEIIINSSGSERRIAILEDGRTAELFVETSGKDRNVGDIYLGKVAKVMPGIRAAFIDIGLEQDAFLHFSDIGSVEFYNAIFDEEEEKEGTSDKAHSESSGQNEHIENGDDTFFDFVGHKNLNDSHQNNRGEHTQVNLKKGQDILVQVIKEPVGKKGVRVRTGISLPGRYLVLIPFDGKVGVSRKLGNFRERRRLRRIVRAMLPPGFGAIIRTAAEGKTEAVLRQDLDGLVRTWKEIEKSVKTEKAPALIYKDLNTTSSVIRDLFQDTVQRVVVDDKKLYKEIRAYIQWVSADMLDRIELYRGDEPIFDKFGIEKDIHDLMSKKIRLKSGGYIIIERTEAMTVIDVNSGRYAAKKEQELNSLRTNLEAAREICRQLRLRDIGGLIVVDFIDMQDEKNDKKIYDEVKKEIQKDRAKITVLPLTEFSLMQITRQRVRQSVQLSFSEQCPMCGGSGLIQSKLFIFNQIDRWLRRFRRESKERRLELRVNPIIADFLSKGLISKILKLQFKYCVRIKLIADQTVSADEFRFYSKKQNKEVTDQYK